MNRNQIIEKYNNTLHLLGRLTLILATALLIAVPFIVSVLNGVQPSLSGFINGFIKVGMIYIPMAIVEFLIYTPMLGVGGSYLSFLTGNVTNMKIPVVMNSKEIAQTESGTIEHEIISTISVVPLQPILQNEALLPAFNNVVPALFGALGLKYFAKSPKIAVIPLLVMSLLCIFVPSMISQTSVLLIPSGALALGIGFVLFKKNLL